MMNIEHTLIHPSWSNNKTVYAFSTTYQSDLGELENILPGKMQQIEQSHSTDVAIVDGIAQPLPKADAIITHIPGITCVIKTADCLPILLYHPPTQTIAAIHAGWRGLAGGIIQNVLEHWPKDHRGSTKAWLGPAISTPNYPIGDEVATEFNAIPNALVQGKDKMHLNLKATATHHLQKNGVELIEEDAHCTYAEKNRLPSYRREGPNRNERILTGIGIFSHPNTTQSLQKQSDMT